MKKGFIYFVLSFTLIGAAQAGLTKDYEEALNEWQTTYPVIRILRNEETFVSKSAALLQSVKEDETATPKQVFATALKEVIPHYIRRMEDNLYYSLVERLDPVYRDVFGLKNISGVPSIF